VFSYWVCITDFWERYSFILCCVDIGLEKHRISLLSVQKKWDLVQKKLRMSADLFQKEAYYQIWKKK
jgi:hypothetical protein